MMTSKEAATLIIVIRPSTFTSQYGSLVRILELHEVPAVCHRNFHLPPSHINGLEREILVT